MNLAGGRTPSQGLTSLWDLGSDQLPTLAHGWLAATTKTITVKPLTGPHNNGDWRNNEVPEFRSFLAACTNSRADNKRASYFALFILIHYMLWNLDLALREQQRRITSAT
jgi:hypothetical protein